jgi:4-hydroxy-2-oxoheptanedioate aldolase
MTGLKQALRSGESVLGTFAIVDAPIMMDAAAVGGMDFVILDTEHGPLEIKDLDGLIPAARAAGICPVVRVGRNDEWMIGRALDIGAAGVQVPQVNCRADAEAVVRAAKYAPLGERGVSTYTRAGRLNSRGAQHFSNANAETLVIVHIENLEGVKELDRILEVEGIDVLFLGPYDLSQSMGIPGQTDDPRLLELIADCVQRIRSAGKVAGSFASDAAAARRWLDMGMQYIAISVDASLYAQACGRVVKDLAKISAPQHKDVSA